MTSYFPDVSSKEIIKVINKLGFKFIRQSGSSHAIYRRETDGARTTVPMHGKKSLKRKTVKSICKDVGISIEDLRKHLENI